MASLNASRYTVGWIAPTTLELTPAIAHLEEYAEIRIPGDDNDYYVGRIGNHRVVMAVCPQPGTHAATILLANLRRSFPNIRHVLVVGIAGAVPRYGPSLQEQIVLGDVVVSYPQWSEGGVAHFEFGAWQGREEITRSGHNLEPSVALLSAVSNLRAMHMLKGPRIPEFLYDMGLPAFEDPGAAHDYLFPSEHPPQVGGSRGDPLCNFTRPIQRSDRGRKAFREENTPHVHYGTIGSSNALVASSAKRNRLYNEYQILCFESESAGVMYNHQALVIRGIWNYADSQQDKTWQRYAAATAAACAKEVLMHLPPP